MAGLGVILILIGAVTYWSGENDLSVSDVIKAAIEDSTMPPYTKGAGLRKVISELLAFELIKSAASGLSSLVPGQGGGSSSEPSGGEGTGEGEGAGEPAPEPAPEVPVEGFE